MTEHIYTIVAEQDHHQGGVRTLLAKAFGPTRMQRAIYRMREGVPPDPALCFVLINKHDLVLGVVRNYRVTVGNQHSPALMLGPIATAHSHERMGLAARLINHSITRARELGHQMIYLVGNPDYYGDFGFTADNAENVFMPSLESGKAILGLELQPGTAKKMQGEILSDHNILLTQFINKA
jgi:predicted N-acetyltransferase YhbS